MIDNEENPLISIYGSRGDFVGLVDQRTIDLYEDVDMVDDYDIAAFEGESLLGRILNKIKSMSFKQKALCFFIPLIPVAIGGAIAAGKAIKDRKR